MAPPSRPQEGGLPAPHASRGRAILHNSASPPRLALSLAEILGRRSNDPAILRAVDDLDTLSVTDSVTRYSTTLSISDCLSTSEADTPLVKSYERGTPGITAAQEQNLRHLGAQSELGSSSRYPRAISLSSGSQSGTSITGSAMPALDEENVTSTSSAFESLSLRPTSTSTLEASSPPSLEGSDVSTLTSMSADTHEARNFRGKEVLQVEDDNLLVRYNETAEDYSGPRRPLTNHPCVFWFLRCSYASTDLEEWWTHCLAHLRCNTPPKKSLCPICLRVEEFETGEKAWEWRMAHISLHLRRNEPLIGSHKDRGLFKFLWNKKLISDQELKDLQTTGTLQSAPHEHFTVTAGRQIERRGRPSGAYRRLQ